MNISLQKIKVKRFTDVKLKQLKNDITIIRLKIEGNGGDCCLPLVIINRMNMFAQTRKLSSRPSLGIT